MMTTQMLSIGTSITSATERMKECNLKDVFQQITGAKPSALEHDTTRLRKLLSIDKAGYRAAKTRLPYVVGSIFVDGVRRIDSLIDAHYFILDVDHIQLENGAIPDPIMRDPSVALAFVSPGGEGVKIFCKLDTACRDPKRFSEAYKIFASAFADRTGLSGSLDLRTSDVSRACFLSFDRNAHYNPNAIAVDWQAFEGIQEVVDEGVFRPLKTVRDDTVSTRELDEQAYKNILKTINPNTPVRREKEVTIPRQLLELQTQIGPACKNANLEIIRIEPINYGLKIVASQGYRTAEVNIFYGKKGYSVVLSPKTGTDPVLNDLLYSCIYHLLFPPVQTVDIPLIEYLSTN
jgi:hypothetical protein